MRSIRSAVTVLFVLVAATACSAIHGSGDGPRSAKSINYDVAFGDAASTGEANVSYTDQDGGQRQVRVTLPWQSDAIRVKAGTTYRLSVDAPANRDDFVSCGVHTDNGWNTGPSTPGGHCDFNFPEDVGS